MSKASAERDTMARRKRLQGALSLTTATLGLSALGVKGGSVVLRRVAQHPKMVARAAGLERAAEKADKATVPLLTTSAGIGGVGGFNFAAIQRAEAKREKSPVAKAKQGLTPQERKQKRKYQIGVGALYGASAPAVMAVSPGTSIKDMTEPARDYNFYGMHGRDPGGMGTAFADKVKQKATEEPHLNADESTRQRYEKVKNSARGESTEGAREAFANKAKSFEEKYGVKGGAKWYHKAAGKVIRGPKSATAAIYGGTAAGMAGLGVGLGTLAARSERKRDARISARVRESMSKSAFGVVHKAEPKRYPESGNFDPEVQRKNRARNVQNTATATAAGLTVGGVAAHPREYPGAVRGFRQAAGEYSQGRKAASNASKVKVKTAAQEPNFGRRMQGHRERAAFEREASHFKGQAKATAASSAKRLIKLKPKVLAGAGVAGAVALTTGMLRRDKAHRSYSDWWDATT